jgi:serine/threonine protein phosphatase PrpC
MTEPTVGEYRGDALHACWGSDIGNMRSANEDAVRALPEQGLFIISDGMGGEYAGAYAAELVVGRLPLLVREHLRRLPAAAPAAEVLAALRDAARELNYLVRDESSQLDGPRRMGATLALALVRGDEVCIAHMGDSRIYHLSKGALTLLTQDHSIVGSLVSEGVLSPTEARYHPLRGQLVRFVGMGGEGTADLRALQWGPGERLLLCSDGLNESLDDEDIRRICGRHDDMAAACRDLIESAKQAGSGDNITVLIVEKTGP